MTDRYPNRLAAALGAEVDRRKWSNRRAGTEIGLNHVTIGAVLMGTTPTPSWETIHKVAAFLKIEDDTARRWLREPAVGESQAEPRALHPSSPPAPVETPAPDARELIRLTVLETIEQMDRRRPRVDPMENPIHARMVETINATLDTMSLPGIEVALECVVEASRKFLRTEAPGPTAPK